MVEAALSLDPRSGRILVVNDEFLQVVDIVQGNEDYGQRQRDEPPWIL